MRKKHTPYGKVTRRISLFIFFVTAVGQLAYSQDPTISGDITYPGNEGYYPSGELFIMVMENPSTWPPPPEEFPVAEQVINPPVDLNNPVPYSIEVPGVDLGDMHYIAVSFDEDNTQTPPEPEAGYMHPDGLDLSAGSVGGIYLVLEPMVGGGDFNLWFDVSGNNINLSWDSYAGADEYWIGRADHPGVNSTTDFVTSVSGTTFNWSDFQADGQWYYKIFAVQTAIVQAESNEIFVDMGGGGGGYSLELDGGTNVETNFTTLDGGPELTFELFFKMFYIPGSGESVELFRRENWGVLKFDGTQQEFTFGLDGIGQAIYTVSPTHDQWHHIVAEYDGSNLRIYWDGMSGAPASASGNLSSSGSVLHVGENLVGLIDVVRISDTGIYGGGNFDPYSENWYDMAGVFLLWHCDEGSGSTVYDESGNGHDGAIYGTPMWNSDEPIGFMGPQLWSPNSGSDFVDLQWDRWPDSDADFVRYNLRWNTWGPDVGLGDTQILDETNVNTTTWTHTTPQQGDNYYKMWMHDQSGDPRYETSVVHVYVGGGNGRIDFTIESPLSTVSGNIYMGVYYDGNPDTGQPDVSLGPYWHDFNSGNYSDFIDGIVEGDDYAVAAFFDRDGSPNGGPDICDAGQDMSARIYNVDVWGTNNIGTLMLADCGGSGDQVTVMYPNGGETFTEGDNISIQWDWTGASIGLDIYLSQNSGGNYDYYIGSTSATDESYSWTIPNDVASANCRIAIEDSAVPSTFDESDGDFNILDTGGALGEFTTDHQHLYWVAEEGSQDTAAVLFSNVGSGELIVDSITSSNPASLYPAGNVSFPIVVNPGETEAVVMIIDPSVGPGTWNGTINFDLGNAASNSSSIDFTVEVFAADSVEITTGTINNAASGLYDLIDEVSMSINFSSVSVSGEGVLINYVDGILPLNPAGDQGMAIADRFWEIISSLEDGEFSADLCFDLSELEGIDNFTALKILKRSVYSDGTWEEISGGDLAYDEINNIICADNQTSFSQWTVGSDSSGANFLPQLEVSATQLNFEFGVSDQEFNVGNSGVGTLYWNINVEYLSGDNWLNLSSESGDAANSNEDTIVVSVVPTGSEEDAQILVNGYTDSDMTDLVDTDTVMVHLDAPAAPEILSISGDTEAFVAQPFNITAVIRAEAALDTVELRYIIGGETDIRSVGFNFLSGETWGVQVPGNHVINSGFFYFVAAKDVYEKETTSNPAEVRVGFTALNVHQTSPETYSMFSVPGDLSLGNRNIEEQFGDELGSVDPEQWRIFRWKNGQYVENSGELEPGSGFWIITREAVVLQAEGGKSTQLFGGTAIALESGWNMVGNPYVFDVDMSDVEAEGGAIEPALYEYNGGGYNTVSTLKAGRGYWLYANSNTTITVKPLGAGSVSRIAAEELSWHGSVSVASGDLVDGENVFGAAANASTDWDALDRHEPPVIGDYVTLAFDNDDWTSQPGRYSRDIRNSSESGHVWSLSVITNRSGYVTLSVELPVELPEGWELFLVDNAYRMVQNLSVETEYEFTSNGSETPRKFEIIAGPPEFTREVMSDLELIPSDYRLAQNVPNPFNAITTIQFSLPEENNVSLTIYDLVGRKVAEPLSNEPYGSGGHFMIWNGKDSQGQPVSSGVYLYRLKAAKNGKTEFTKTKKLILLK